MGYEVAGGLGVKMADPEAEVYVIVGDGSYLMMHSELLTSIQEGFKIHLIVLNNSGYQCIHHLQRAHGSKGFGNEFRQRGSKSKRLDGQQLKLNFTQYAESLGAAAYYAVDYTDLQNALVLAKQQPKSTLIEIPVLPGSMSKGYDSWWRVGVAEVSQEPDVEVSHQNMQIKIKTAKAY